MYVTASQCHLYHRAPPHQVKASGGAVSDAVLFDPSNPNTGPGLCARRAVAPGETLVAVPAACTLRVDDGHTPPALLQVFDEVLLELRAPISST